MNNPSPAHHSDDPSSTKACRPAGDAEGASRPGMTWSRLLAGLTISAVLVSGINALVQVARVAVDYWLHGR